MDLVMDWLNAQFTGVAGLVAWLAIVVVVVGTALLMRHLSLAPRALALGQVIWIVAVCVGLLVVAGFGGFMLMHNA